MDTKSLQSLLSDPSHYAKAFKVFCARSAKFRVYSDWVDGVFSEAVVGKLQATMDGREELRVLGVGSGSGEMDCAMLEKLKRRFPRINNRVVEPSRELLGKYKSLAQSKAHELQGVECDFRQQTLEQYEKAGDATKFHFISAVHCMYHLDDYDSSLEYLYNCLIPGGAILVIHMSENTGLSRYRKRFPCLQPSDHNYSTSADIRSSLDRRGIPFTQHPYPVRLDITKCFDQASEEGGLLLDFLTFHVNFRETAPEDLQRSVMECFGGSDCSERKDDAIHLIIDWDAIVISKPKH
ncbi:histamine N-methyltransferase-like [Patiria miniata]|uniref:Histamine N-methyltransferase n=1 Tax=Patiria miniata TaxID=46514 RepID=A0A914BFY5_PATMI|nr:histamine N-methyltransferase-like [Patiria miniata]XP_038075168.1 histamine N-methyltransferase-like [Patiria miniata]